MIFFKILKCVVGERFIMLMEVGCRLSIFLCEDVIFKEILNFKLLVLVFYEFYECVGFVGVS